MARLDPVSVDKLSPEHKALYEHVKSNRPKLVGPFSVLMHAPAIAKAASDLNDLLRTNSTLELRIYELIVLTVARHWSAQYAFAVHESIARKAGLSNDVIEALRARTKPSFTNPDETLVYDAVTELLSGKVLSQPTYDRLVKEYGVERSIEVISVVGLYNMIAMILNGFDVPTANGEAPFK